ncbi:MAG: UDP-N-acetylmuramoyl-tripeptide--D-alanyl-D-alanine ligase [Clostridia bacterium]|nr:UDP-N-acetylmuramoyl-tripeptide--D-alanyl-D-alanine ligase [Clostridia bacterium]
MEQFTLKQAAQALGSSCGSEQTVKNVVIDTRLVEEGSLFFAIKGERFDGHDFVGAALEAGACGAVCTRVPEGCDSRKIILVDDTSESFLALAAWYRQQFDIPVVGITGSVGKTTTKEMVACVLATKYKTLFTEGNLNNQIGVPRMCFKLDKSCGAAVLEMGMSAFGEISSLTRVVRPTVGLITNIGVSHIENLGSREGILKAKMEILEGMNPEAPLFLNADNDLLSLEGKNIKGRKVYYYSAQSRDADYYAENIKIGGLGSTFDVVVKESGRRVSINLPAAGMHNVLNACAAIGIGDLLGVDIKDAAKALEGYTPTGMRQKIVKKGSLTVIEDCYNASPDSVKAALSVLRDIECDGRRIAVLGDMLELGAYAKEAHTACGEVAAQSEVDMLFAYGDNARYYVEGVAKKGLSGKYFEDKNELFSALAEYIDENDTILFKASRGMKLEEIIERLYTECDIK